MGCDCPDPEAAPRAVTVPSAVAELKELIEESVEAQSVILGFASEISRSWDERVHRRVDNLVFERLFSSARAPEVRVFTYEYIHGDFDALDPSEFQPLLSTAHPEGHYESSKITVTQSIQETPEATHRAPPRPSSSLVADTRPIQTAGEFEGLRNKAILTIRLFHEVLCEIDQEFAQRSLSTLADIRANLEAHWHHYNAIRGDLWRIPVIRNPTGDTKHPHVQVISTESTTLTFDMDVQKATRIRKLAGIDTLQLPLVLFDVDQPENPYQTTGVLTDPALFDQLASQLQEIERRTANIALTVFGYADGTGEPAHNTKLSENRAQWVILNLQRRGIRLPLQLKACGDTHARARTADRPNPKQRSVLIATH